MSILWIPFAYARLLLQSALLALGQIWANKMRSMLTTTGIIIGVASVTAVIAGLAGLKTKVLTDFQTFGTNKIFIWADRPEKGPMKSAPWDRIRFRPEQVEGLLEHCPSVEAFTKTTWMGGTVSRGQRTLESPEIAGVDPAIHKVENRSIVLGRPFSTVDMSEGRQVCVITPNVIDKLLLDRDCVGETLLIDHKTYTIIGVIEPAQDLQMFGGQNGEPMSVYVPFTTAFRNNSQMRITALAKGPEVAEEARAEITFYLRRTRDVKPGDPDTFGIQTMQRVLDQFNSMAVGITAVAAGIVGVSLLVGGIGIMNIMLVSVSERTREIGLRKAVGARPSAILLQFLVEAVMLCLVGGAIGLLIGWLMTKGIAAIPGAKLDKAYVPLWAVEVSIGFSTAVGLIFGMFPAIKAARLDPIEALRHE
jgi:putative ABC transport system permease protein